MSGGQDQEEDKAWGYGNFQGPPSYPPPRPPPLGFPPARPAASPPPRRRSSRFLVGFFLGAIPWYVGAILLWCSRVDHREKPGYVACTVAAVLATLAVIIGATAGAHVY
ncbi:hypothetical protein GQ55_5G544600 [Panicum hallii var. hallii]|uniref:60S ribosomal protein L18a-like protein n=1 Tax=Panicum hallii var. hallii TaxID=1504633 RepID=A0A2T7DTK2_9POAL|nr:hypothetical protein GQ55_5G544600 [Panicum hallii var. hallii]